MRSVGVVAPDRTQWTVRVVWEPRWRALTRRFGGWRRNRRAGRDVDPLEVADGAARFGDAATVDTGTDLGDAIIVIVVVCFVLVVAAVLFWWVLLPLLLLVLDAVIVLILLVLALAGRVLFRRPWTVEATATSGERITADVVGWRAALRRRDELAAQLAHGDRSAAPKPRSLRPPKSHDQGRRHVNEDQTTRRGP